MKKIKFNLHVIVPIMVSVGFLIWSGLFVYQTSFITIDRQRSYSLFDDAMISMRYAWNFSHGYGLVWNPGEYVQGYTNLLMVLIMSLATLVLSKTMAVLSIQILGILFLLLIAYLNLKIARVVFASDDDNHDILFNLMAFSSSLLYYPLIYWSVMGMETGLLSMLLLAGVFFAFQYMRSHKVMFLILYSLIGGLAFLTRNDSFIFFFVLWVYIFASNIKVKMERQFVLWYVGCAVLYFVFIIGQMTFQYMYYGDILPNTYALKMTGMPLMVRVQNGLGFVLPFLKETALIVTLSMLGLLLRLRREKLLLFLMFGISVLYQIYVGGDPWSYWRMMVPTMPLLFLLCLDAIFLIGRRLVVFGKSLSVFHRVVVILALIVACVATVNYRFWPEISFRVRPYQVISNQRNVNIAIALNDLLDDSATVGVYWAGAIPYYVDKKAIDFLGKSDRYIANLSPDLSGAISWNGMDSVPGHNKYDLTYSIVKLKPTYVQKFFWGRQSVYSMVENEYVEVRYRYTTLYLLKDSPDINWERVDIP